MFDDPLKKLAKVEKQGQKSINKRLSNFTLINIYKDDFEEKRLPIETPDSQYIYLVHSRDDPTEITLWRGNVRIPLSSEGEMDKWSVGVVEIHSIQN